MRKILSRHASAIYFLLFIPVLLSLSSCQKNLNSRGLQAPSLASTGTSAGLAGLIANTPVPVATARLNNPTGTAVDVSNTVYVADFNNHVIRKITPKGMVSTLAGSGTAGFKDGPGASAQFNHPTGLTVDRAGNVYVADFGNQRIRKITPEGVVTTLAGDGIAGNTNGTGAGARFNGPAGIAIDGNRNLYVADEFNRLIRKITPEGVVSTWAGDGKFGYVDGRGVQAEFSNPEFIVSDAPGNLYLTDGLHNKIRKIDRHAVVTTLAGTGYPGMVDGPAATALFHLPTGISVDMDGTNVYVSDEFNQRIRKIGPDGKVSTIAGFGTGLTPGGYMDGPGINANFQNPQGLSVDAFGVLYVADYYNNRIRKISTEGFVSTLAGTGSAGYTDGPGMTVRFGWPMDITIDRSGNLYVLDEGNHLIRKITPKGIVSILAGSGLPGTIDGPGVFAQFNQPYGITVDSSGNLYVAETINEKIRKITPDGTVSTFAGTGDFGSVDGPALSATFWTPIGLTVDHNQNVYVGDLYNNRVRKITQSGIVSTLAGGSTHGYADGTGTAALFYWTNGVAADPAGNIYVVDQLNARIRKITPAAVVSTLAGGPTVGFVDGTGAAARFNLPHHIATDAAGNVYVSDFGNHAIRKITPSGVVSTLAGNGTAGYADGMGSAAMFNDPGGLVVDAAGNIYVVDGANRRIRKITPTGLVSTFAGDGVPGY